MSHIPSSAMKHAGPTHHDESAALPPTPAVTPQAYRAEDNGIGAGVWIAIGGTMLAGAVAALAVPLLRARKTPDANRRGKKATAGKAARKPKSA